MRTSDLAGAGLQITASAAIEEPNDSPEGEGKAANILCHHLFEQNKAGHFRAIVSNDGTAGKPAICFSRISSQRFAVDARNRLFRLQTNTEFQHRRIRVAENLRPRQRLTIFESAYARDRGYAVSG